MTKRSAKQHVPHPHLSRPVAAKPNLLLATFFKAAVDHQQAGRLHEAEAAYRTILSLDDSHAMVWSNLAVVLLETQRLDESIAASRTALKHSPDHFNAQLNLASALQASRMWDESEQVFRSILARHPRRFDLWKSLAAVLESAGKDAEAVEVYDAMIAIDPKQSPIYTAKAEVLRRLGRTDAAIMTFRDAVRLLPDDAVASSSLGIMLAMHSLDNNLDEAANLCLRAAMLEPNHAPILNNLAVVLQMRDETDNALLVLRQLTVLEPKFPSAHSNIGSILSSKCRYDEAEDSFLKALDLDPNLGPAKIELTKVRRHLCNWSHHEADAATIRDQEGSGINFMIVFMAISLDPAEQLAYARSAMVKHNNGHNARRDLAPTWTWRPETSRRLRIGYISADFREHPVGRLIPDLIAGHDRGGFEVFGYSLGPGCSSTLRYRIATSFDHFRDFSRVSDAAAVDRIRADGIDILVDLTGPTAGSRFAILAQRPAPVQVSFLGLPGTTGADCIDYIIADRFLVPDGSEMFFHEKVVRLPGCYQPSDSARQMLSPLPSRAECGLPENGFVFCSFNSPVKITPEVFDVWLSLLQAVEGSVLWFYCKAIKTRDNLLAWAKDSGVSPERIIFTGPGSYEIYLTRLVCADLLLDTFPYAAGATCNDALWAGLPVLTCVGETYVSRMAGSLLTTLGLDELVTHSLADYRQMAIELATNPAKLDRVKQKLLAARSKSALFDMRSFATSLELAFRRMAGIAANGAAPQAIDLG